MFAFLDTEFTDLVIRPRLLSIGIATGGDTDRAFYAEVTDLDRLHATNLFGVGTVLPQFGKVANAACSYAELGNRLATFLAEMVEDLDADEFIELAFGYHLDWELVDLAIKDAQSSTWANTQRRIRPVNVYEFAGYGAGKLATEAYFKTQNQAPYSRHHALCDARALRVAYEAVMQAPADFSRARATMTSSHSIDFP